jgi:folate-binding protein YgfZ
VSTADVPADVVDLRVDLGAVRCARDVVRVAGPDAEAYLQGQLSQDVAALDVRASAWSFVLQPAGKVDAWVRVTRLAEDAFVLDVDAGHGEAVLARLRRFLLRTKADVDPLDWRAVALRGPGAEAAVVDAALRTGDDRVVAPAGWPGVEGVDVLGADVSVPGVPDADAAALESLRVRSGVPAMDAELTEATIPAEVGQWVVDASVSFTKGCFTGQELVARINSRGGHVPRRVRGVVIEAGVPGGVGGPAGGPPGPAPGDAVIAGGAEVGRLTSVAPAPGGGNVALASVGRAVEPPAAIEVIAAGGTVTASLVDLPIEG